MLEYKKTDNVLTFAIYLKTNDKWIEGWIDKYAISNYSKMLMQKLGIRRVGFHCEIYPNCCILKVFLIKIFRIKN